MKGVKAIRYIDASYFFDRTTKTEVGSYICIGKIKKRNSDIVVAFSEYENKPREGLIIPIPLLNVKENIESRKSYKKYVRKTVGILWQDVTFFWSGVVPKEATVMYTEGVLIKESGKSITIVNPLTLVVNRKRLSNHPSSSQPAICSIPKSVVISLDVYEN